MTETELYDLLDQRGIAYEVAHHPAVMTVAEAAEVVPDRGAPTKNLFLRDDKKRQFFLVTALVETQVDLRHLHERLGGRRLSAEDKEIIIRYYVCECFGQISEWLKNEMRDDVASSFRRLCRLKRGQTEEMVRRCEEDHQKDCPSPDI